MNIQTKSVLVAAIAALAVTPLIAKTGGKFGTNILHLMVRVPMTNNVGVESTNATGTLTAVQATQGAADHESLTVSAKGLMADQAYNVVGISNSTALPGGTFIANSKGNLTVKFGAGKRSAPIFADATQLQEVDLVDASNSVTVLTGNFTNATSLQYLVKQDISTNSTGTNNVSALLQIKSTKNRGTSRTSFSLNASGLDSDTDYLLVFNGGVVQTNTSDARGRLKINSAPTPTNILDLVSVDVTDTNNVPVTATATLP